MATLKLKRVQPSKLKLEDMGIKIGIGRMQISHGGGTPPFDWSSYWETLKSDPDTFAIHDFTVADSIVKNGSNQVSLLMDISKYTGRTEMIDQALWNNGTYLTLQAGWSVNGNKLTHTGATSSITKNNFWIVGAYYEITYTVERVSGTFYAPYNGSVVTVNSVVSETKTYYYQPPSVNLVMTGNTFEGSLTALSIKRVDGNHLYQLTDANKPVLTADGLLFDGVSDILNMLATTFNQPSFLYIVLRQKSWTLNDAIFTDTFNGLQGNVIQYPATPGLRAYAGIYVNLYSYNLGIDTWGIMRVLFNGANSFLQINNGPKVSADFGNRNMTGFYLGGGYGPANFSNIEVKGVVARKVDDALVNQRIHNGLRSKYELAYSGVPMIGFICDDDAVESYTEAYRIFEEYGFKGGFAVYTSNIGVDANQISVAQLQEMNTAGHEILSHSVTHVELTTLTAGEITDEIVDSKAALEAMGLTCDNFVYPYSAYTAAIAAEAGSVYEACIADAGHQYLPIALQRVARVSGDTYSLVQLKAEVDTVIAKNGESILLIAGHPGTWDAARIQIIDDLCAYIQSRGLAIQTLKSIVDTIKTYTPTQYYDF